MSQDLSNEALNEGVHVDQWSPSAWTHDPGADEEWQPEVEPPHINDYAALKKHKHYGRYFRPYRYHPFPAWVYHKTLEPRLVKSKEEVLALGPEWSPIPNKPRIDMTGKTIPGKSQTQHLAEVVEQAVALQQRGGGVDQNAITMVVAAVMAAMGKNEAAPQAVSHPESDGDVERTALIELAEKEGIKIDKRWSKERIKKELGLD